MMWAGRLGLGHGVGPAALLSFNRSYGNRIYRFTKLGLFGIQGLNHPQDFKRILGDTKSRCDDLLRMVLASESNASVVQIMDDLSDELCRTYDAAECCRNVHVDPDWRMAATEVCSDLGAYISEVNHHAGMYGKLASTMQRYHLSIAAAAAASSFSSSPSASDSSASGSSSSARSAAAAPLSSGSTSPSCSLPLLSNAELAAFDSETVHVGDMLCLDMEKAGIHLEAPQRARMQELMNLNNHYSMAYNQALTDPAKVGSVSLETPKAVGGFFSLGRDRGDSGSRSLVLDSANVNNVLVSERSAGMRQQVYMAASASPKCNLQLLDEMIAARKEMAGLVGCSSFSEYKARNASLAQEPGAIVGFLSKLSTQIHSMADDEVKILGQYKVACNAAAGGGGFGGALCTGGGPELGVSIFPWDTEFFMAKVRADVCPINNDKFADYLNLGSVLEGVSELLQLTFGVQLKVEPAPPSESWAPNVLKATAYHPDMGQLGTVYLDLLFRPGKYPSAVTFPIRCGRSLEFSSNRKDASSLAPGGGDYQLPIMALLADFGGNTTEDAYLNYRELRVLLHELGHCMHNLLSRTRYQHLWGTRCAQDMVEVPSHLFEHFVSDHRTLRMLARHKDSSREALPEADCERLTAGRQLFSALDLQQQILFSLVDQEYFGPNPPQPGHTSEAWAKVAAEHSSIPYIEGTSPEARLSHLTVYGASYYSYVYARCLSAAIWNQYLGKDPLDRSQGDIIRQGLLQPGGSKPPLALLQGLLPEKSIQQWPSKGWAPSPGRSLLKKAITSF